MKRYQLCITMFWMALGLFVSAYSFFKYGLGHLSGPGPGLFPGLLGAIIFCFALYKLITEIRVLSEPTGEEGKKPSAGAGGFSGAGKLVFIILTLVAYALLLEWLGYILTTFLAMVLLLRFAGYTKWARIIAYSVIIVGVSYFMFHYLGVIFPPGVLGYIGIN